VHRLAIVAHSGRGFQAAVAQKARGRTVGATTMEVYAHVLPDMQIGAAVARGSVLHG
jgi:hypothetical protein